MQIEDSLPEHFKTVAFKSGLSFGWKKNNLEKLFEELLSSNIAIVSFDVWLVQGEKVTYVIPLKSGHMKVFNYVIHKNDGEEWFDFVERSLKEVMNIINRWNLEKMVRNDLFNKIYYNFKLEDK